MKMVVMETTSAGEDDLETAATTANNLLAGSCTAASDGATLSLSSSVCYTLTFNDESFESIFTIDTSSVTTTSIAIFTEHDPGEFESTSHYLLATDGTEIEAEHELPEDHDDESKPWGAVIIACLVVNLASLSGVAVLGAAFFTTTTSPRAQGALQGFAAGALLAAAFFLMLIEASHLVSEQWSGDEVDATWRWGAAVLGGFATPLLFSALFDPSRCFPGKGGGDAEKEVEMPEVVGSPLGVSPANSDEITAVSKAAESSASANTVMAVCIGDFAHNITDGFAIGIAFKLCSRSLAMGLVAATLYHEVAQEISDFVILTSAEVGLSTLSALAVNFLVGTSCILGGILATGIELDDGALGLVLAFGGGTYLYLGAAECLPRAFAQSKKIAASDFAEIKQHRAVVFVAFLIGTVSIGLILLDHEHCEADDAHGH